MKKIISGIVFIALTALGPIAAAPSATAGTGSPPATCAFERWYPGAEACEGQPWEISIKQECAFAKVYSHSWWASDSVCQSFVKKHNHKGHHHKKKYVTVRKHNTLWNLAVKHYGNGHKYPRIMRLNHLQNTTIKIGQRLRIR